MRNYAKTYFTFISQPQSGKNFLETWSKIHVFITQTGNNNPEIRARYAGKMVISSFFQVLWYIILPLITRNRFWTNNMSEKKNGVTLYWSPKQWIYFKTTVSIPCLYFSCHSSSYSVSIPVKVFMILTFPPLFVAYLLRTPDNSNLFWFAYKVWVIGVNCILFTKSPNQSSWKDLGQTKLSVGLSREMSQQRDRSMGKWLYSQATPNPTLWKPLRKHFF